MSLPVEEQAPLRGLQQPTVSRAALAVAGATRAALREPVLPDLAMPVALGPRLSVVAVAEVRVLSVASLPFQVASADRDLPTTSPAQVSRGLVEAVEQAVPAVALVGLAAGARVSTRARECRERPTRAEAGEGTTRPLVVVLVVPVSSSSGTRSKGT